MSIIINDKKYRFNDNIRWGIYELITEKSDDPKVIKLFINEILIPTPTAKERFEFKESDVLRIFDEYSKFRDEKNEELKKKLSRSYEVEKLVN